MFVEEEKEFSFRAAEFEVPARHPPGDAALAAIGRHDFRIQERPLE